MTDHVLSILRCPLCKGALRKEGSSLVCSGRHCYNIARQGHVNFVPNQKDGFYKKELFESRAKVFEAGVFAPVVAAITDAVNRYALGEHPVVVDAGCGEGYYVKSICPERAMERIGFDLSKEAVRLAARGGRPETFFAADLANIPLADGCADVLLDVFTPANYREFGRILKPEGVVVKLAPRAEYLRELRAAAGKQLRHSEYSGDDVQRYAGEKMDIFETRAITYTMPVDAALAVHLARMTPMLAGVDVDSLDLSGVTTITIDETMTIGRIRAD